MFRNLIKTSLKIRDSYEVVSLIPKRFAGHSKWQNIRHIKGAKDAERSALFSRLSRQMKVAIQEGGSADIKRNSKLENVVEQAKRANMPVATIQNVIKSCENDKSNSKPHLLEFKGPGGCIILCEVFTSNLHQLRQNISTLLRKHQSKYSDGGAIHLFDKKGIIVAEAPPEDKDKSAEDLLNSAIERAVEAGAEDVEVLEDRTVQFTCGATNLKNVVTALEHFKYNISSASVEFIPLRVQELSEADLQTCSSLYQKLESLPDVVRLSDNVA